MTILKRQAAWLGLVTLLMAGVGNSATTGTLPDALPLEGITFLPITNKTFKAEEESWTVKCEDHDLIKNLVLVLQGGQPSKDHKCPDSGIITIQFEGGKKVKLGILPGHDEKFYQYRLHSGGTYAIYQTDRPDFLDALEAVGCPVNDSGFPR